MIQIDVEYYNKSERDKFQNLSSKNEINNIVKNGVSIDPLSLLSESMFMEWKDHDDWNNRGALLAKINNRKLEFDEYFSTQSKSLVAKFLPLEMENHRIERVGVGFGLSVVGKIFNLQSADWEKIPTTNTTKTLDFAVASTGDYYISVECKGTIATDKKHLTHRSKHSKNKSHIKNKKINLSSDIIGIGIIAIIPHLKVANENVKVLLVDPPMSRPLISPRRFKILSRYRSYRALIRLIGTPRMLLALNTRIYTLESVNDFEFLDEVPLFDINGRVFDIPNSFLFEKSIEANPQDFPIVGKAQKIGNTVSFLGIDTEIIPIITRQSHNEILNWSSRRQGRHEVDVLVKAKDLDLDTDQIITFDMSINSSGLAIGYYQE